MNSKKIINIINFLRGNDHRETYEELFDTFCRQLDMCKKFDLPNTFLLQYDVLTKPDYTNLLLDADEKTEVGVWIEMAKEQVEKVGLKWNGRPGLEWDWFVNPDMLCAYTQKERELLIDELMDKFKSVFGYYPKSAGSWLLDSYSIEYMKKKYDIEATCICREQFGTDGYTLWGGYFNQGYYPCRKNMLIPAQTKEEQINVPIFRMLGTDPIHQYDMALDEHYNCPKIQALVATLEPTCGSGKDEKWVDWYLNSTFDEESMSFAYTQAGQENSFTWKNFGEALLMHMEKIADGAKNGKWEVMTLKDTGRWFSSQYAETPPTAVTALTDYRTDNNQTVWYDCKNYRINLHIKNGKLCIRDMFIFDENYVDRYYDTPATGNTADYDALPVIDGCLWGGNNINSVLYFIDKATGEKVSAEIEKVYSENNILKAKVKFNRGEILYSFDENGVDIVFTDELLDMQFKYNDMRNTEIVEVKADSIIYSHCDFKYGIKHTGTSVATENGYIIESNGNGIRLEVLRV